MKRGATMTEQEWLKSTDPWPVLQFLRGNASDRKLRLFAVSCHRRIWHLLSDKGVCRKTVEFAERYADGLASRNELHGHAWGKPGSAFSVVLYTAWAAAENSFLFGAGTAKKAVLRMDVENYNKREDAFKRAWEDHSLGDALQIAEAAMPIEWMAKGNAAWTEELEGQCQVLREIFGSLPFRSVYLDPSCLTSEVKAVAEAIYDQRTFDHLPHLADALEEAGCHDNEVLSHCRSDDPHVRGCWALDLILGKE
jgi:hypothetical protein